METTLIRDNCFDYLGTLSKHSIDCIITDPPYNITKCEWDRELDFDKMWELFWQVLKPKGSILIFGQEPFSSKLRLSQLKYYKYDYYWQKERCTNIMQVKKRAGKVIETISVFYKQQCTYNPQMVKYEGKKRTNKVKNGTLGSLVDENTSKVKEYIDTGLRYPTQLLYFPRDILKNKYHPTQKPVALCEYLIKTFTNEDDTILDPFMGGGSIGVAAKKLYRNYVGIEKEQKYFDIVQKRIN